MSISALYVHIPFCHTICPFCAFAVHGNRERLHRSYLHSLAGEIARCAEAYRSTAQQIASVYIGGGTPSTLPLAEVGSVMRCLREGFPLAANAEVAFEVNPEDASREYFSGLLELGINRISIGAQSFDDRTLRALRRNHDATQSLQAAAAARSAGVENFNIDLMLGAPGVEPAIRDDVRRLLEIGPAHVSIYALDIEEGTLFGRDEQVRQGAFEAKDEQAALMMWAAQSLIGAGYRHYEVSNFCLPGAEGRQNTLVWDGAGYLGFGVGAHSYADRRRWWNVRHLRAYNRAVCGGSLPVAREERLNREQQANEHLMLALRRDTGLDPETWRKQHGFEWSPHRQRIATQLIAQGHAVWSARGRLCLTTAGLLLADAITAELMV